MGVQYWLFICITLDSAGLKVLVGKRNVSKKGRDSDSIDLEVEIATCPLGLLASELKSKQGGFCTGWGHLS